MNQVTLADGRQVPSDSLEWRDECLVVHAHVVNLRDRGLQQRREYLAELERKAGAEIALRVMEAFKADWAKRKAGKAANTEPLQPTESNDHE